MQEMIDLLNAHPSLNYGAYVVYCVLAWSGSLWVYEKATPYREWTMVAQGNQAAAWSLGGVAIGLALPLCSVVMHAQSWGELVVWSLLSLASQIVLWFVLGHTVFAHIKASMEKGTESVGILLGACAISFGLMVAACAS